MMHFYPLRIKKIKRETEDCVSLTFEVPEEWKEQFRFKQGQSLTVRTTINGQEVRRTYSICSSPLEEQLCVAVKKVEGGLFSSFANDALHEGSVLDVLPPVGNFYTELYPAQKKNYVAVAAGSGITPILSLIKTTLHVEPHSTFTLVYGNRNRVSIIFKEELEALKDKFISRFRICHILSREQTEAGINQGRIDEAKCRELFETFIDLSRCDEFFLCGPEQMIFTVRDFLLQKGVRNEQIHFELFTVPGATQPEIHPTPLKPDEQQPASQVTIKLDGVLFSFDLPSGSISILEAGLQQGADLPYACKGGVCTTCKAKLVEGTVDMDVNWGLDEEEVKKGYILTCQSHPTSPTVTVDFDAR